MANYPVIHVHGFSMHHAGTQINGRLFYHSLNGLQWHDMEPIMARLSANAWAEDSRPLSVYDPDEDEEQVNNKRRRIAKKTRKAGGIWKARGK